MRGYRLLIPIMLFLMVISCSSLSIEAETLPPNMGDWIISDITSIRNQSIVLKGDLIVQDGGELWLFNVDLKFNCESDEEFRINVEDGGKIVIYDTTISSNTEHSYVINVGTKGEFSIYNSTLIDYTAPSFLAIGEKDIIGLFIIIIIILAIYGVSMMVFVFYGYSTTKKRRTMATTTMDSLIGKDGMVLETVMPNSFKGKVRVESRIWSATSDETIPKDEKIKVVGNKGINVIVEKFEKVN